MSREEKGGISSPVIPEHVAIIMDGNGRWAKERGQERTFGHQHGRKPVRESVEAAIESGVRYLTLYTFSTENWKRPKSEVSMLLELLSSTLREEIDELIAQGVRFNVIGEWQVLPSLLVKGLRSAMERSADCNRLVLTLALNYGGRQEILRACNLLLQEAAVNHAVGQTAPEISEAQLAAHLYTHDLPDPELVIRTSGEQRLSNFLLWQLAYAEMIFLPIYWPDFRKEDFRAALVEYATRNRRFGGLSV